MTGEMTRDMLTPEEYPVHFAAAEALGGTVVPFDVYQGPYILLGREYRGGSGVYATAPRGLGVVRLWLLNDDGGPMCQWYNEASEKVSEYFWAGSPEEAIEAAREIL